MSTLSSSQSPLFCIWLLQWWDLWSSSLLSVSFSNKFGILCWFQTYLKELGSLKEESSCWPGEKLAWIEEKDSEKGNLSYHTLWQRRDAGQCGCIPRLPAACVVSGLVEGSWETLRLEGVFLQFSFPQVHFLSKLLQFRHQEFCCSWNISFLYNELVFAH